ncbi:MAG: endospore germination permease [Bacillota bacterium]
MREEGRITAFQVMLYQVTVGLPTIILLVPAIATMRARQDVWLSGFLACLFGFAAVFAAAKLALRFPDQTVIQYTPRLLGGFLGKAVGFLYIFSFFFVAYVTLRQFGELMTLAFFPETPIIVFLGILTLLACYVVYLGLEVLCRLITLWGVFGVSFFIIVALFIKDIEISRFLPFLEHGIGPVAAGAIAPGGCCVGAAIILMVLPFMSDKHRAVRNSLAAIFILFAFFEMIIVPVVGTMGAESVSRETFPYLTLYRRMEIPTMPVLERQDPIIMGIWIGGLLWKVGIFMQAGLMGLGQWLGLRSYRPLIFPAGALVVALAVQGWESVIDLFASCGEAIQPFLVFPNFILTALLLLVAVVRGVKDKGGRMKDEE